MKFTFSWKILARNSLVKGAVIFVLSLPMLKKDSYVLVPSKWNFSPTDSIVKVNIFYFLLKLTLKFFRKKISFGYGLEILFIRLKTPSLWKESNNS